MSAQPYPTRVTRRFMTLESGTWGVLSTTNTAFVSPLLLAHGARPHAFGSYNSAVNPFGPSLRGIEFARDQLDRAAIVARTNLAQRASATLAAERLGVDAADTVVAGDSIWDLLAAHRAHALGVGLLSGEYGRAELAVAGLSRL